ncbi:MAG: peptidylprolyl isomerase [Promethearchaeota archaeon]
MIELFPEHAPGTVANFLKLVNQKFYDGLAFHRVIPDFVVQGGDPYSKNMSDPRVGTGGPGWKIKCETDGNPLTHKVGAISMAHAGKDTGGSQFFIVLSESNTRHLNGVHTVFAQVTDGVNLIPSIRKGDRMIKVEQVY